MHSAQTLHFQAELSMGQLLPRNYLNLPKKKGKEEWWLQLKN